MVLLLCLAPAGAEADGEAPKKPDEGALAFAKARKLQVRGKWRSAKKAYERFLKKFPDHPLASEATMRGGENAMIGVHELWHSGPPERRIDVAVMGDGFTVIAGSQSKQEKWAKECLKVLWHEKAFGEYKTYFNYYFVRLASKDEYVDPNLTPEQRAKLEKKNKHKRNPKRKVDYSTALDAKAAGPGGQVMCDRRLVYKWLEFANKDMPGVADDRFVIAFAQFGKLGMGGGGIANVGRPDKSVTTHEFGHAFSRLLDEYANNPGSPQGMWARTLRAANAYPSATEPKKTKVPWAHFLKARTKGVGIFEGGATFQKGVWRPARSCAMNAAGATAFCPVCREQTIRVIYEYVSPIDEVAPPTSKEVETFYGDSKTMLVVTPMQPARHKLVAEWFVKKRAATTRREFAADGATDEPLPVGEQTDGDAQRRRFQGMPYFGGPRAREDRSRYAEPPSGELSKLGKRLRGKPHRLGFPFGLLPPGLYTVTVEVRDPTKWVLKDKKHLLKERASWDVAVRPKGK